MKQCGRCKDDKPLDSFAWKNKAKGTKNAMCKHCQSEYAKTHYGNNKDSYKEKARVNGALYTERNLEYVVDYLKTHPCVDCGESDIVVLEFDHRIPLLKRGGRISSFMGGSLETLKAELAKCDVVCSNCHTRRTAKMFGWARLNHV